MRNRKSTSLMDSPISGTLTILLLTIAVCTTAANAERERIGDALKSTLSREDADASTLNALAWYCSTSGMYLQESLEAAKRAADLEPENTAVLDTLAEVLFRSGRPKEAITTIERAIAIDPEDGYLKEQRERFLAGD